MAGEATIDPAVSLPDFPAEQPSAAVAKPKRTRKPRAKVAAPPKAEAGRPILHLKSSAARQNAEPEAADTPVIIPAAADHEAFELTGASDAPLPSERATPRQIEIPELQMPSTGAEDAGPEQQNGALQETATVPLQTAALPDEPLPVEPVPTERADLNGSLTNGNLHAEPPIENGVRESPERSVDGAATDGPATTDPTPQSEAADQEIERAPEPEPFEDPRFTYVPRWRSGALSGGPSEQDVDDRQPPPAVAYPEPHEARESQPQEVAQPEALEAREQQPVVPATAPSARSRKISALSLRAQLALIALTPIFVGAAIAFLVAFLSPTLFAARSEIVVNVTSMDWSSAERFLATQLVVVKARSTLQPISEATDIPLRDLEKNLKAELIGSSDVISIQYANSDPSLALTVVKAVTAQYLINLRDYEQVGSGRHRVLMPATMLDDPVSLKPLYAALIGAVVGFAIGVLGIVLRTQLWRLK